METSIQANKVIPEVGAAGAAEVGEAARSWLQESCVPLWLETAWDVQAGGFVESLTLQGAPEHDRPRRFRVQPRQVYSFSCAHLLGLGPAGALREQAVLGLEYLTRSCRSPEGGWVHILDRRGGAIDPRPNLYDHTFIILAGAAAYRAFGETQGLELAREALDFVRGRLQAPDGKGFHDPFFEPDKRLSNPHMHLLESCLELYRAAGDDAALDTAREVVALFVDHMRDPRSGAVFEDFDETWTPAPDRAGRLRVEPGHCYEWAFLLGEFEALSRADHGAVRQGLVAFADRCNGQDDGWACNAVTTDGALLDSARRLWPQLEKLRVKACSADPQERADSVLLFGRITDTYLSDAAPGAWMDEYDRAGRPVSRRVPASMLYHVLTGIGSVTGADVPGADLARRMSVHKR